MKRSAEVDKWFKEKKPPAEAALQRAREVILRADPRVTESVKYGTVMHLEGSGPTARFIRFKDVAEVDARAKELAAVVAAWCANPPRAGR